MPMLVVLSSVVVLRFFAHAARITESIGETSGGAGQDGGVQCLNGQGRPVDFYYTFKYPRSWNYAYMDAETKTLEGASDSMADSSSPVSRTLDQLYRRKESLTYSIWNDEPPSTPEASAREHRARRGRRDALAAATAIIAAHEQARQAKKARAHAKGVMAFDGRTGFWLIHSVPKFPMKARGHDNCSESYSESISAIPTYAQALLCISFDRHVLKTIDHLFTTEDLAIYDSADNAGVGWVPGIAGQTFGYAAMMLKVTSLGGRTFDAFSISGQYGKDLYSELIAKYFKRDFIAETARHGVGDLGNHCGELQVMRAEMIQIGGQSWRSYDDHSKWAVSEDGTIFCLGGVNRQSVKFRRGGGMYCIDDPKIGEQMRAVIVSHEECFGGVGAYHVAAPTILLNPPRPLPRRRHGYRVDEELY